MEEQLCGDSNQLAIEINMSEIPETTSVNLAMLLP